MDSVASADNQLLGAAMVSVFNVVIVHGHCAVLAVASAATAAIVLHVGRGATSSGPTSWFRCVVGAGGGVEGLDGILYDLARKLAMGTRLLLDILNSLGLLQLYSAEGTYLWLYGEAAPQDEGYKRHQGAHQQYEVFDCLHKV